MVYPKTDVLKNATEADIRCAIQIAGDEGFEIYKIITTGEYTTLYFVLADD